MAARCKCGSAIQARSRSCRDCARRATALIADTIARAKRRRERLAEYVAEGGSIWAWSKVEGMSYRGAQKLWADIRAGLGAQAA